MRIKAFSLQSDFYAKECHKISQTELKQVLNHIKNHPVQVPKPKSIALQISEDDSDDLALLAVRAYRQEERRIYREECNAAFKFKVQNSMKGGIFSLAQQIANKSGKNILAIDNVDNSSYPKRKLFKPHPPLLRLISSLGYSLLG
ncbi:hypothetical protein [Providencia rettgeri]|uniref:hypothetical protein n=1 Tax=Providencia rettgeri TaxID=587 RepID=UPI0034E0C383